MASVRFTSASASFIASRRARSDMALTSFSLDVTTRGGEVARIVGAEGAHADGHHARGTVDVGGHHRAPVVGTAFRGWRAPEASPRNRPQAGCR